MGETTHISWCDHTFNPWLGCTRISNGPLGACAGCYAAVVVEERFGRAVFGGPGKGVGTRARTSAANWKQPLAWDRKAARDGTRPFVFCASLADVFDNAVDPAWRRDLFDLIRATPHLTWLLLTKRPGNITSLFVQTITPSMREAWQGWDRAPETFWPANAAIGCTVVTQEEADRDIPQLLAAKAALTPAFAFVSMEPLLGPVDLTKLELARGEMRSGQPARLLLDSLRGADSIGWTGLDWVITGGETDQGSHKARPTPHDAETDIRDQCAEAGVPYHRKQAGEWIRVADLRRLPGGQGPGFGAFDHCPYDQETDTVRVGKRVAGRMLDGVTHDARPTP
jgi:protein gp37